MKQPRLAGGAQSLVCYQEEAQDTEEDVLTAAHQPPSTHELHSVGYWRSVANQCVRTYCSLQPEPKTLEGVVSAVWQGNLKDIAGTSGKDTVLTFLCMDLLGESSQGPGAQEIGSRLDDCTGQPAKRKHEATWWKVTWWQCTLASVTQVAIRRQRPCSVYPAQKKRVKDVLIVFDDQSIQNKKQRVRGSYVSHTRMVLASSAP